MQDNNQSSYIRMYARTAEVSVEKNSESRVSVEKDLIAIEEPLEISVQYVKNGVPLTYVLTVTMRTPGDDESLAVGFLIAEGIISSMSDVREINEKAVGGRDKPFPTSVEISLYPHVEFDPSILERRFLSTSSCGVCGRLQLNNMPAPVKRSGIPFKQETILRLPEQLKEAQTIFHHTGGLHAAGLFDQSGALLHLSEDIGRHNAMDKLIGRYMLTHHRLPSKDHLVLFSGRVSYELIQKSVAAGIMNVAAIGAPSSLAVELAQTYNMMLIGFLRDSRYNVYAGF